MLKQQACPVRAKDDMQAKRNIEWLTASLLVYCFSALASAEDAGDRAGRFYSIPGLTDDAQTVTTPQEQRGFFARLGGFYKADWTGKLPSSPSPQRRALDAPLDSSPFPSSD